MEKPAGMEDLAQMTDPAAFEVAARQWVMAQIAAGHHPYFSYAKAHRLAEKHASNGAGEDQDAWAAVAARLNPERNDSESRIPECARKGYGHLKGNPRAKAFTKGAKAWIKQAIKAGMLENDARFAVMDIARERRRALAKRRHARGDEVPSFRELAWQEAAIDLAPQEADTDVPGQVRHSGKWTWVVFHTATIGEHEVIDRGFTPVFIGDEHAARLFLSRAPRNEAFQLMRLPYNKAFISTGKDGLRAEFGWFYHEHIREDWDDNPGIERIVDAAGQTLGVRDANGVYRPIASPGRQD